MNILHECFRADIEYSANSSKTYLKIPEVQLEDEGLYKCEATYMAVNRECNNVQHIILNVTGALHYIMQHRRIRIKFLSRLDARGGDRVIPKDCALRNTM